MAPRHSISGAFELKLADSCSRILDIEYSRACSKVASPPSFGPSYQCKRMLNYMSNPINFVCSADEVLAPHQTILLKLLDSYLQSSSDSTIHSHLCPTLSEIFFRLTAYAQLSIRIVLGPAASDGPSAAAPAVKISPSPPLAQPDMAQAPDARLPKVCEALVLVTQCVITVTIDEDEDEPDGSVADGEPRGLRAFFNDARSDRGEGLVESLLGAL